MRLTKCIWPITWNYALLQFPPRHICQRTRCFCLVHYKSNTIKCQDNFHFDIFLYYSINTPKTQNTSINPIIMVLEQKVPKCLKHNKNLYPSYTQTKNCTIQLLWPLQIFIFLSLVSASLYLSETFIDSCCHCSCINGSKSALVNNKWYWLLKCCFLSKKYFSHINAKPFCLSRNNAICR